jgi:hypothetical protein
VLLEQLVHDIDHRRAPDAGVQDDRQQLGIGQDASAAQPQLLARALVRWQLLDRQPVGRPVTDNHVSSIAGYRGSCRRHCDTTAVVLADL